MNFDEYQEKSRRTAIYPSFGDNVPYLTLGLVAEAGEVADKIKKFIRDHEVGSVHDLSAEQKRALMTEAGDVLWYIAQLATECGYSLTAVADMNIEKTHSRLNRGKLGGSGDDR